MLRTNYQMLRVALLAAAASGATAQTAYLVFPIPDLPAEAVSSSLISVSDDGVCTGVWFDEACRGNAFIWVLDDSEPSIAGYIEAGISWERETGDINIDGHWAKSTSTRRSGYDNSLRSMASPANGLVRTPAYWIPGAREFSIGHLGGERGACRGICDTGKVVGWSETRDLDTHGNRVVSGFTWNATDAMRPLTGLPTFAHFTANDIHPSLDITIGTAWDWDGVVPQDQLPPLGTEMHAADSSAVLVSAGVSEPLDTRLPATSVWHITGANAINTHGWIAGSAQAPGGVIQAVLVIPNQADIDRNGSIGPDDFAAYLYLYITEHAIADLNADSVTNVLDIEHFIERYKAGMGTGTTNEISIDGAELPLRQVPMNCLRAVSPDC